jgi:signal peptidase complex subunit 2
MVAQFYPMPFPDSRPLLGVCCAAYFIASSVLQFIVTYIEKDCIMTTNPILEGAAEVNNKTRAGGVHGIRICTNFPRFSYDYTISVQVRKTFFDLVVVCFRAPMSSFILFRRITSRKSRVHLQLM